MDNNKNIMLFLKENKNIIVDDFVYIYQKLKLKKKTELLVYFFIFTPFIWVCVTIFIIIVFIKFLSVIREFIEKYLLKYIYKEKYIKPMKCEIEVTKYTNEILLFIIIIYKRTTKYIAYYYIYTYLKILQNIKNKKKEKIWEKQKEIILILLRVLLRFILLIILNYSILVLKTSIDIYDIIKKCFNEKTDSLKTLIQIILIDILNKYHFNWYIETKKKRIKFLNKKIKLNMKPSGKLFNKALEYSMFKVQINSKDTEKLKNALEELSKHTDLRYSQLETEIINNKNLIETIKEKKPHTSAIVNIDENEKIMIRATTSKEVQIKNEILMKTHTPSKGIINPIKTENRTDVIGVKKENVKNIYNPKLIKNLEKNPTYIDCYKLATINSLENKTYIWDGGLHKDPKYINLIDKIENDPILKKNLEIKKCLDIISEVYQNNIRDYKFKSNRQVFDAVIKTIISQNKTIDQGTLSFILKLIENE